MKKTLMVLNGANTVHIAFADAVGADKLTITERVAKRQFPPLKAFRLVKNSLSIPSGYESILCESCYYYPAIKRRLLGLKSRIININCGPLLYNIHSGRLKGLEGRMLRSLLNEVDAHLVFGSYGAELVKKLDPKKPVGIVYPYIGEDRYGPLMKMTPNLGSKEITIIANDDIWCKGIDILIEAFNRVSESEKGLSLNIVTDIPKNEIDALDDRKTGRIRHLGLVKDIVPILARTALYVHPSRGDTFPRASLEAMAAGIPTIVSDETGTKELVEKIDNGMVCRLDSGDLAERISRYFGLSEDERERRSAGAREAAMPFSKTEQTKRFRAQFERMAI